MTFSFRISQLRASFLIHVSVLHEAFLSHVLGVRISLVVRRFHKYDFQYVVFDVLANEMVTCVDILRPVASLGVVSQENCSNVVALHDNWVIDLLSQKHQDHPHKQ